MLKIIHFVTDDKFISCAIELFNLIDGISNDFYQITQDYSDPIFLNPNIVKRISLKEVYSLINRNKDCNIVVLHNFYSIPYEIIQNINNNIKVVWFSWGYDIYSNKYPTFKLIPLNNRIKKGTLSWKNKLYVNSKNTFYTLRELLDILLFRRNKKIHSFIKAINRIDYYSGVFPIEYKLLKENNLFFRAKPITFNYIGKNNNRNIDNIYKEIYPSGNVIQVGNAAFILGNHINSFSYLKKLDIKNKRIFVPLSYGGNKLYVNSVLAAGYKYFKENFFPVTNYMPAVEYSSLLRQVSVAIYNIEQQAAVGNIILNLWNGSKVFLPKNSVGYIHFKSLGFTIFTIEDDLNQKNIDNHLDKELIIRNREIIIRNYSFEAVLDKLNKSLSYIINDCKC